MKQYLSAPKVVLLLALTAATICISGFREKDSTQRKSFRTEYEGRDTTPSGKRNRNPDIELDKAMQKLDEQMKQLEVQMKNMDFSKIQKELDENIKKIDFDKIAKEVEASMAKVDWNKIEMDVKGAMEKVKNVDMVKLKAEMQKVKEQMEKVKIDVNINSDKIQKEVAEAMEKAKVSIEKAKVEMKVYKEFTNELEADKLIDKKKGFKIQVKDGDLYINDVKQSKEVSDKYRKYYKKADYSITSDGTDRGSI